MCFKTLFGTKELTPTQTGTPDRRRQLLGLRGEQAALGGERGRRPPPRHAATGVPSGPLSFLLPACASASASSSAPHGAYERPPSPQPQLTCRRITERKAQGEGGLVSLHPHTASCILSDLSSSPPHSLAASPLTLCSGEARILPPHSPQRAQLIRPLVLLSFPCFFPLSSSVRVKISHNETKQRG